MWSRDALPAHNQQEGQSMIYLQSNHGYLKSIPCTPGDVFVNMK